jgi:archaellum biogenesis protein FlaJ (TadC family)
MDHSSYRETNPAEKLLCSAVNAVVAAVFVIPFLFFDYTVLQLKLAFITAFLIENLISILFFGYRLPGMWLQATEWKAQYAMRNQFIHAVLYTMSFSTLCFWIWFPGDLFLINMLLVQLPCVMLTKNTLHGLLAGRMVDVKQVRVQ